jgi:hypothetical protein
MSLAPPVPISEFTPRERPDPYDFAALDVLSEPAWRFEKGVHYDRTEDHLLKWARRYADGHGLTVKSNVVRNGDGKAIAVELAFSVNGPPNADEDPDE